MDTHYKHGSSEEPTILDFPFFLKNAQGWECATHLDFIMGVLTLNNRQREKALTDIFRFSQNIGFGCWTVRSAASIMSSVYRINSIPSRHATLKSG